MEQLNNVIQFLSVYTFTLLASMISLGLRVWVVVEVIKATQIVQYIKA